MTTQRKPMKKGGLPAPNKNERILHDELRQMGCCVCKFHLGIEHSEASIHHILSGGRKISHSHVLPLCPPHHQYGTEGHPSRHSHMGKHGGLKAFEDAYGTEYELLEKTEAWLDRPYSSDGDL